MLNQIPNVVAPHPPHILKSFTPLLPIYDDLAVMDNFERLIDDVCKFVELNPVPWEHVEFDRAFIKAECRTKTLLEVFRVIYEVKATKYDANIWCCKSMANVHFYEDLEGNDLEPLYIHLYRDGRDVALSFKKAIVGEKHAYHIAKQWKRDQEKSLEVIKKYGPDKTLQVSYEDLLLAPEKVMKRVCEFLKVTYDGDILDYYNSEESKITAKSGKMWENLVKPIMSGNHDKFKKESSAEDILTFEKVAGDVLKELGYELTNDNHVAGDFSSAEIEDFDQENEALKKSFLQNARKENEGRKMQNAHIESIKSRKTEGVK
jgi:hypothetical protein